MATVQLRGRTSEKHDLPDVCMRCGAPTTLRVTKKFTGVQSMHMSVGPWRACSYWHATVSAPLCAKHRRHWFWRKLTSFLTLLPVPGFLIAEFAALGNARHPVAEYVWLLLLGAFLSLLAGVVVTIWLWLTAIRPREITDRSITLTGVSEAFVRAYEEEYLPDPDRLEWYRKAMW
jgi:hypothetical protein